MKKHCWLLMALILTTSHVFAVTSSELTQNINNLVGKINQVNADLAKKQQQQQNLTNAINDSKDALQQEQKLYKNLQQKASLDQQQLQEIAVMLPQITEATSAAESNVKVEIAKIYSQIRLIDGSSNSILSGNEALRYARYKAYLVQVLKVEMKKLKDLEQKLAQLNQLNVKLHQELVRLNQQLVTVGKNTQQLQQNQVTAVKSAGVLQDQIDQDQNKLSDLKATQAALNRLLAKLNQGQQHKKHKKNQAATSMSDGNYEDNSPFLARQHARPVDGSVILPFGSNKNGFISHGVLFSSNNSDVHVVAAGRVAYVGQLPGIGPIVVINHGDGYVSIYGGVIPTVSKGQTVTVGQTIANSGNNSNQPMGGVYFELRHLGKPVNPNSLLN